MDNQNEQNIIQARVFRRLLNHLRTRNDVQNIDMMNLTGFCRNCLANWYKEEMEKMNKEISKDDAREFIYSMPFEEWKQKYQKEATQEQIKQFEQSERLEQSAQKH